MCDNKDRKRGSLLVMVCYWPFVRRIHWSPVNSPHKGQWRGTLMFSLICTSINSWVNNREAGDLRRSFWRQRNGVRTRPDVRYQSTVPHNGAGSSAGPVLLTNCCLSARGQWVKMADEILRNIAAILMFNIICNITLYPGCIKYSVSRHKVNNEIADHMRPSSTCSWFKEFCQILKSHFNGIFSLFCHNKPRPSVISTPI